MKLILLISLLTNFLMALPPAEPKPLNKLIQMYQFYYLPFSIDFKEGDDLNDILPYHLNAKRLLTVEEMTQVDKEWAGIRQELRGKSLLNSTELSNNESNRISQKIVTHKISLNSQLLDHVKLADKILVQENLKGKSDLERLAIMREAFLHSFLGKGDSKKFNLFIIAPDWCDSSKEYRTLLEAYSKEFKDPNLVLHSIIIVDPEQKIFDSELIKTLLPNKKKYTHETVPVFFALDNQEEKAVVKEEADALQYTFEMFYKKHRGYLDSKMKLFREIPLKQSLSRVEVE